MKNTDMELQAIREKLLSLQAEPATPDGLPAPWQGSGQSSHAMTESAYRQQLTSQPANRSSTEEDSPQAVAIKALRKRSGNPQADSLIAQEINRLQVLANNINERSQQQSAEILAMKRSAQQAAVALRRQGVHDHPQLQVIEQFLVSCPSASVPVLERDRRGQFCLNHSVVDLHRAEQDASSIASALRRRQSVSAPLSATTQTATHQPPTYEPASALFVAPIESDLNNAPDNNAPDLIFSERRHSNISNSGSRRRSKLSIWKKLLSSLTRLFGKRERQARSSDAPFASTADASSPRYFGRSFSWTDAAIWFSGAAIARIILEAIVVSFPLIRMPILIVLFSIISFSIYRVVVAKSTDMPSVYRLAVTLIGLIVGGSL